MRKLPADPNALIFGITSVVIVFLGCCCGIFVLVSLVLSIVGLVIANKSLKEYDNAPEIYSANSKNNVFIAKILSIIALVISSIYVLILIVFFFIYGTFISGEMMRELYKNRNQIEQLQDSLETMDYESDSETDSLYMDSIQVETQTE